MSSKELKMSVGLERLFLWNGNPRHKEVDGENEAIEQLCKSEDIAELAKDIRVHGVNPAERLIVFPVEDELDASQISSTTSFIVAEGNRRVCALKLLHDPDRAPSGIRPIIQKASKGWSADAVDVVVILDEERRRHWLKRIHDGVQGGVGRKPWNTEQKTRFSGTRRNVAAQVLLDYAQSKGMISEEDRKGSFSHMARLVGNVIVAETLGLDYSRGPDELQRNRPVADFDAALEFVVKEAKAKNLGSQAPKADIDNFARRILAQASISGDRITPEPVVQALEPRSDDQAESQDTDPQTDTTRPKPPKHPEHIASDGKIRKGLEEIGSQKLNSLYYSICTINAKNHTPLIAVAVWSFLECITASMGRQEGASFVSYLNRGRLSNLGVGKGQELNAPCSALERCAEFGNVTKHHKVGAAFHYPQLINDMQVLGPTILACIEEVKKNG